MEDELRYLSVSEVIGIHEYIMEQTGAAPMPLRDPGRLEAACMRPQMAAAYANASLLQQAALLAVGIAQAQAFLEGNKRTAYAALDAFLRVNGWAYNDDPLALAQELKAIATRTDSLEAATARFVAWLEPRVAIL